METRISVDLDEGSRLLVDSTFTFSKACVDTHEVATDEIINLASCLSNTDLREVSWDTNRDENKDKEPGSSFFVLSFNLSGIRFTLYSNTLDKDSEEQQILRDLCKSTYTQELTLKE